MKSATTTNDQHQQRLRQRRTKGAQEALDHFGDQVTITLREAAKVLGISDTTAYRLAEQGEFPVPLLRAGRRYLVPTQTLFEALGLPGCEFTSCGRTAFA